MLALCGGALTDIDFELYRGCFLIEVKKSAIFCPKSVVERKMISLEDRRGKSKHE
jgi:hypothetical protein